MKKYMVKESQYKPLENKIIGLELLKGNGPKTPNKPNKPSKIDLLIESFNSFRIETNSRFDKIDSRLDRLETDVNDLKTRMTKIEERLDRNNIY